MKKFLYVFVFLVTLFLVGCQSNSKIVDEIGSYLLDNIPDEVSGDLDLIDTYKKYDFEVDYTFDDQVISEQGVVKFTHLDQKTNVEITVKFKGTEGKFSKSITVLKDATLVDIDKIANHIKVNTPSNTKENINLITKFLDYDFEVSYSSEDENLLTNEGIITRGESDKTVRLKYTITYNGQSKDYYIDIRISRYNDQERITQIGEWLDSYMKEITLNETGTLPTQDAFLNNKIEWFSNYPGVIDDENNINVAFEAAEIRLIASSRVGLISYTKEYTYMSKGLDYNNKEEYIDKFFTNLMPEVATSRVNIIYNDDLEIIQSIVSPNTINPLRPKDPNDPNKGRKMPGGVKWIVIHDTGNPNRGAGADMHDRYIHNQANSADGRVASWHYTIDDHKIYQHVPDDEQAWHAGDNNLGRLKGGNSNGIGIETCINPDNDYELTLRRTAKLTAQLLYKHNLLIDSVTQHYDFSQKACPGVIRSQGWWPDFLKMVERELLLIMLKADKANEHKLVWTIDRPDIIDYSGRVITKPLNDEIVNITLDLTYEGFTKTYNYEILVPGMTMNDKMDNVHFEIYAKMPKTTESNIELITSVPFYDATITWSSSHPGIISNLGEYNKPNVRTIVTLTAYIKIGEKVSERVYNIAVS